MKQSYFAYYGVDLVNHDQFWAPNIVCRPCVEGLRRWTKGQQTGLKFGVPIVWNEPQDHPNDCYFCTTNIKGLNPNKKTKWHYPDLESVRQPIPHSESFPIPVHTSSSGNSLADSGEFCESDIITVNTNVSEYQACCLTSNQFSQNELRDLIRDLNL